MPGLMSLKSTIWKLALGTKLDAAEFGGGTDADPPTEAGWAEPDPAVMGGTEAVPPDIGGTDPAAAELSIPIETDPEEGGGEGEGGGGGGANVIQRS